MSIVTTTIAKIVSSWYLLHGIIGSLAPELSLHLAFQEDYNKISGRTNLLLTKALQEDMSGMINAIGITSHVLL